MYKLELVSDLKKNLINYMMWRLINLINCKLLQKIISSNCCVKHQTDITK